MESKDFEKLMENFDKMDKDFLDKNKTDKLYVLADKSGLNNSEEGKKPDK